ncbi:Fc receptor-like protein 5 isoform X2 [Plectropomus leopardus]|uniref:Fc receptor-like protein 5 isoform X2 n=1 Tax=Plectropomus leopardus TaxID=160734 RepID=UPI001C4D7564|nr:Fc receptor-like protein 5 isoform X2 [Plectropomus leopardus]
MRTALLLLLLLSACQTSTRSPVSVTITPSWSQFFEYKKVSVSCDRPTWTVWRYTINPLRMSQCGEGWGDPTASACIMETVKVSDSGVYWCESKHRDSSRVVNITITDKKLILQSPVLPVAGDDVTLRCTKNGSSGPPADFYKNDILIGRGPKGHMTIHRFSKSDAGAYKCKIGADESPLSWLQIRDDSAAAALTASPDSAQLFEYNNLNLSCRDDSGAQGWKIMRSTASGGKISSCGQEWGDVKSSDCIFFTAKQPDSATYWCESPARQRSNSLDIAVHDKNVILQSPLLPVTEGDDVTLTCRAKTSSSVSADFYKDGVVIRNKSAGHMTIRNVSTSDEGRYKCRIRDVGESSPSWLFVRVPQAAAPSSEDSTWSVLRVLRHLLVFCPYCVSTVLMVSVYCHRPAGNTHLLKNLNIRHTKYRPDELISVSITACFIFDPLKPQQIRFYFFRNIGGRQKAA